MRAASPASSPSAPASVAESGAWSRSALSAIAPSLAVVSGAKSWAPPYTVCTGCRVDRLAGEASGMRQYNSPHMNAAERANQRNAVLAGFLGWTLDAFDFFVLTFVIQDVANAFGRSRADIAWTVGLALITRPIGAIIFGLIADRYGRRLPLMLNVIFYATISVLCGFAPNYMTFVILRLLFGIGMGGEWGVGASLALESASPKLRGLLSGLLQEGYALGNLLAALAFRAVYPYFESLYPGN